MPGEAQKSASGESLKRNHEVSEKRVRNVLLVAGGAAILLVFSLLACGLGVHILAKARPMNSMAPLGILIAPNLEPFEKFPKPNLQIDDDHAERMTLYAAQTATLNSYGWIDRSTGIVRIPIDRAMDLILQQGLPAQTNDISHVSVSPLQLVQQIGGEK
jgi:hypothetical protein